MKRKGCPPKRLKSSLEQGSKIKHQLNDHTNLNIQIDKQNNSSIKNLNIDIGNDLKDQKCEKYKQFEHYAKTCPNNNTKINASFIFINSKSYIAKLYCIM
ncbi:9069_t:CDS:2 [Cetraspora pellucida]|uniref:9069_t:CDS:1 n=1 Tax=Cetraspora pellucida TaxID=1433469 RepID=A0A9N9G5J8_9GLOM|nr:9069_t:CDS:2 [Cetraspora pellucida]